MTPHLDDGRIAELLDGEIPSSELAAIQAHLAACPDCTARLAAAQAALSEAEELVALLDEPTTAVPVIPLDTARRPSRHDWLRRAAWAASLVVAAGAGYLSRGPFLATPPADRVATTEAIDAARPVAERLTDTLAPTGASMAPPDRAATTGANRVDDATPSAGAPAAQPISGEPAAEPQVAPTGTDLAGRQREEAESRPVADAAADLAEARERALGRAAPTPAPANALSQGLRLAPERQADSIAVANRAFERPEAVTAKQALVPDTIDLAEAVARLGGSLRLVDGLIPTRIETAAAEVHVVYRTGYGELRLAQRRMDNRIVWRLIAPVDLPADSLAAYRRRVEP